uniref:Transmembrane protein 59 n=1 Tax=Felis catus TaxID=9685 RepID=A0ABI7XD02_FELCA
MAAPKGSLWVRAQLGFPPLLLLTMALAGGSRTTWAEVSDPALGDTASYHWACQLTFLLHTYPKEEELYLMLLMPKMHLFFPLTLVRSFWSDMMDSEQSFITSPWTFYLQGDDGKIVIFQSKPEIQYAPQLEQEPTNLKELCLRKMSYLQTRSSQTHRKCLEDGESDGFLRCFPLNSGWILTTTPVLSVMVLLWTCCATVATAVEQYVPSEELSIYGDLEFVNAQKLNRYPLDYEEAGPLPTKVNLAHSEI